jgi:D-alanyl-D-alanine carboxypeptidase
MLAGCTSEGPVPAVTAPPSTPIADLEAFAADVLAHDAPAVVFHVRDGEREDVKAGGVKDLDSKEPAEPGDRAWITGAGTPMVAVSVMKLVEAGTLRLDDPVSAHLPEFVSIFPGWENVTIRHLLGSRSGLPDYFPPLAATRSVKELQTGALSFEDRLRIAAGVKATPGPVPHFAWSATDWEVLGWILERKHDRGLAEILNREVFGPAGMGSTFVAVPGEPPGPMLHGYIRTAQGIHDLTRIDVAAGSADVGIISTVQDLSSFMAALAGGRLIRGDTWQTMTSGSPYTLGGLEVVEDLCRGVRHVIASGGGFPYAVQTASSTDGRQQVSIIMVPPPQELTSLDLPPFIPELQDAVRSTARKMCSPESAG